MGTRTGTRSMTRERGQEWDPDREWTRKGTGTGTRTRTTPRTRETPRSHPGETQDEVAHHSPAATRQLPGSVCGTKCWRSKELGYNTVRTTTAKDCLGNNRNMEICRNICKYLEIH